jgi:hypothetical protein
MVDTVPNCWSAVRKLGDSVAASLQSRSFPCGQEFTYGGVHMKATHHENSVIRSRP